jgi:predicted transcriptional regulator
MSMKIFSLLGNVRRFRIIRAISVRDKLTMRDVSKILNVSDKLADQYLRSLVDCGALSSKKTGGTVYYCLKHDNKAMSAIKAAFF